MTTVSLPSTKSLTISLLFLRASGNPCPKLLFCLSGKRWRRLPPTKQSPSQLEGDCFLPPTRPGARHFF